MKIQHHPSRPSGVGTLMYVGDCDPTAPNQNAITLCHIGALTAIAGAVLGKKKLRNIGLVTVAAGFLAI